MGGLGKKRAISPLLALGLLVAGPLPAAGASYPDRPVRLVVPSVPGGGTDISMRIVAPKLAEILEQQVVIDNRGGAAGNIGAEFVAKATPDGYTLLAVVASHTSNPYVMRKVSYDLDRDFAPISLVVIVPSLLVSHPSLPARNLKELIAFARARPGELQFASAGLGSAPHLMMALFNNMAGLDMIHVPYKGAGPALIDIMAGHVPMMVGNILSTRPLVRSGKLRSYGVTTARRSSAAPEIPTIAEGGLTGYDAATWFGLLAPAATPRDIVAKLHDTVLRALQDPVIRQRYTGDGAEPSPSASPEEFREFMRAESRKWAKVIRDAKIRPE
jgi:tripartite-type tricarboxylate transporter receptor subunit TctC